MNRLLCATHVVADVGAAAARFVEWLGYREIERGVVSADLAASWGAPGSGGRAFSVCAPPSGEPVYVRLVGGPPSPAYRPLRTHGWAAIELCVRNVHETAAIMARSPFEIIGPPSAVAGLPTIHPMQVRGPDDEILFLTQILADDPASGLPRARTPIDRPFILVLACSDMTRSVEWFTQTLGLDADEPAEIPYSTLNKAFDLAAGTLHPLTTLRDGCDILLEIDQYPPDAAPRRHSPDVLPPGTAIGTFGYPVDAVRGSWIAPPALRDGAIYAGRRGGALRTPEGALVEIVDSA